MKNQGVFHLQNIKFNVLIVALMKVCKSFIKRNNSMVGENLTKIKHHAPLKMMNYFPIVEVQYHNIKHH